MDLVGKGFFIWKIPRCENGDPQAIADLAQESQLTHVLIKIADAVYSSNIVDNIDLVPPLVASLHRLNIQVFGWHYVRGDYPITEANKAIERVTQLGLDGYVIDAEKEYKQPGKAIAARKFMDRLRAGLPDIFVALCSYRFPSYHPQLPWREFLEKCDVNMPQVYWLHAHNADEQLTRCVNEFQAMAPFRPIIPVGAAYREFGWQPTSSEVLDFLQTAQSLNLSAANFYSWDSCRAFMPDVWNTIRDYPWTPVPPAGDITSDLIAALNTHDPDQVVNLYTPNAVHITAARTIQGHAAIRAWYQSLFNDLLPNAVFIRTSNSASNTTQHFTWTATSTNGNVDNGNDTVGLIDNKIAFHYSFFTVSS
jgi:hypothetical protein